MLRILITLLAISLASGCASLPELKDEVIQARKSGREGEMRVYPVSVDQAWDITEAVFRWEKTDELEENRQENYVITSSGMKSAAFGTVMGVWIEPVDMKSSRITVIARQRGDCCVLTNLTPPNFFKRFEQGVAIVKSGRRLPLYYYKKGK